MINLGLFNICILSAWIGIISGAAIPRSSTDTPTNKANYEFRHVPYFDLLKDLSYFRSTPLYSNTLKQGLPDTKVETVKDKVQPEEFKGKKLVRTDELPPSKGGFVLESSLPEPYRIIKPDSFVTMDYRIERLNIYVNSNYIITGIDYK